MHRAPSLSLTVLAALGAMLIACSTPNEQLDGATLDGTTWGLESITVSGQPYPIPVDRAHNAPEFNVPAVFEFRSGRLFVSGFCNDFWGPYRFEGGGLTAFDLTFTLLLCSIPSGILEADDVLQTVFTGGEVTVTQEAGGSRLRLMSGVTQLVLVRIDDE